MKEKMILFACILLCVLTGVGAFLFLQKGSQTYLNSQPEMLCGVNYTCVKHTDLTQLKNGLERVRESVKENEDGESVKAVDSAMPSGMAEPVRTGDAEKISGYFLACVYALAVIAVISVYRCRKTTKI